MFRILKLIQPTWYFNLRPNIDHGYFPDAASVHEWNPELHSDNAFSEIGSAWELSYRAHRLGYTNSHQRSGLNWWEEQQLSLDDEYRFARKYFHSSRVLLAFLIRASAFKNTIAEYKAFRNSGKIKMKRFDFPVQVSDSFHHFNSSLIQNNPLVSVIIPTLNRYDHLANILSDFRNQDYKNFEIIIVDQSEPFRPDFYNIYNEKITVIRQEEKALWKARNSAIKQSKGSLIALSEDDVRIPDNWISNHLKCLDFFDASISAGVFFPKGNKIPADRNFFKWADQFATGNACLKKEVFQKTGLFDLQFERQRMGDGEFGLRAYLAGFKSMSNPYAFCEDVKASTGGLRQMGSWDAYRPKSIWSPRPIPSVLYFYRKYFGSKAAVISILNNIPPSIIPYKLKRNKKLLVFGSIFAILLSPLILIQVVRSWSISSVMLRKSLIGSL